MSKDLYEILGLDRNASQADIKAAHRKYSKMYHPDLQGDKSEKEKKESEEKFKEVQHAYEVLSDENKRKQYDMFGSEDGQPQGGSFGGFGDFGDFGNFHFDFGGDGFGFDDIRDMFGGGRSRQQESVLPGRNKKMTVKLSIKDIYNGFKKTVKYTIDKRCPNCHGKGGETHKCPYCNGTGIEIKTTRTLFGITTQQIVCSHCNGTGEIIDKKCPSCNGTGFRTKEVTLDIEIPAGAAPNSLYKYSGRGSEAKKAGHPNGDFIVQVVWDFDTDRYQINGLDITEKIKIPYEDAILGTKYHLILPDDKTYDVTISPNTVPGKKYVLRGKGIKDMYGRGTGNYYIEVDYQIPETLSEEEEDLLEKIREIHRK